VSTTSSPFRLQLCSPFATFSMAIQVSPNGGAASSVSSTAVMEAPGVLGSLLRRLPTGEDFRARIGDLWTRSRPWNEFFNTAAMNKPELSELRERVSQNLAYYAYNYATIFAVLVVLMVLVSPLSILGALAIFALYTYLFALNPEPITALGDRVVLDSRGKSVVVLVFSLVILWLTGAGATFSTLLFVVATIAIAHAAIRKPPGEADFESGIPGA
jgi:hypothetical protein